MLLLLNGLSARKFTVRVRVRDCVRVCDVLVVSCHRSNCLSALGSVGKRASMARKDDPVFNVKFVQLVENQACLWNYTHPGYSKKEEVQRAWQHVANEIKDTGSATERETNRERESANMQQTQQKQQQHFQYFCIVFLMYFLRRFPFWFIYFHFVFVVLFCVLICVECTRVCVCVSVCVCF